MMKYVYKITLTNDYIFYSSSRAEVIEKINNYYKDDTSFKPYTSFIFNNILGGKQSTHRGVKCIEMIESDTFYKAYIDAYLETLEARNLKHRESVRRLKNIFIKYIDNVVISSLNNNESYDDINYKVNSIGLISI